MPKSKNANTLKCGKCQGAPSLHNIRDASISVNDKTYRQHSFELKG